MTDPALLEVRGVTKVYGGLTAVRNVSFSVKRGEIVGVMGANGAGKTTLFNLISGTVRPDQGEIYFRGERIDGDRPDQICARGIGRTFQIVKPFAGLTVAENVEVGLMFGSRRPPDAGFDLDLHELLREVGLADMAERAASQLTLVGRKRLEVARALATRPALLILDEVMAGLTPSEAAAALTMLAHLHGRLGVTMLVVEHHLRAMMQLCQRVVVLHHGEKIGEGAPADIIRDPAVVSAYLGATHA
jgi:branched-chain amino acid transport system ATP-binding protein